MSVTNGQIFQEVETKQPDRRATSNVTLSLVPPLQSNTITTAHTEAGVNVKEMNQYKSDDVVIETELPNSKPTVETVKEPNDMIQLKTRMTNMHNSWWCTYARGS